MSEQIEERGLAPSAVPVPFLQFAFLITMKSAEKKQRLKKGQARRTEPVPFLRPVSHQSRFLDSSLTT